MKNSRLNMILVAIGVLTLMSIMLMLLIDYADRSFENDITVSENGITESVIPVRDLYLTPGDSREYHVNLFCKASGGYDIFLDFEEIQDGGMKRFVNVEVLANGERVYLGPLDELLDDEEKIVELNGELKAKDAYVLTFRYAMPLDIGNEAQRTSAKFDVCVKVKKD